MNKKILFGSILFTSILANAQNWQTGGNGVTVNTTNNYLGTNATNNTFLKIGVQGSQDIFIDNDNSKLLPADASGRLHGGHWIGMGRVFTPTNGPGANAFWTPKAHLHIDGGNNSGQWGSFGNGLRTWMNTGTLYTENSDAMYVGMKSIGNNFSYAMINWSDDAYGGNAGTDFLSFNFTGGPTPLQQSTNGIELGRFNPTLGRGTLGVGNFQFLGTSTEPVRRLEILDADPANGINANAPQLRTTYTYNTTPTQGIFTEFQTTNIGDMYLNTRANGNARNFGFHKINPLNCVEINSQIGNTGFGTANGSSGLRFTNMTSANTPQVNPGAGVLSVDANGDVIYVPGGGAGIANNGISVNAGVTQLGVPCSVANIPAILANQFTSDRIIANRNQNLWIASLNNETGGMGVGGQPVLPFCNLGNTFEISANSKNTQYGTAGSGLRFTKLTSSSATIPNGTYGVNSTKVLTVDGDGDVVLTDAASTTNADNGLSTSGPNAGAIHFGQNVAVVGDPGRLLNNRQVPMYGKNIYFTGQDTISKSAIYVGYTGNDVDQGKLNVKTTTTNLNITTAAIKGINRSFYNGSPAPGIEAIGVLGISDTLQTQPRVFNIGVKGVAKKWYPIGVHGSATGNQSSASSIGVKGDASSTNGGNVGGTFLGAGGTNRNFGVKGTASSGGIDNTGVEGIAIGTGLGPSYGGNFSAYGGTVNYGVFATILGFGGGSGGGPDFAGYFNGDVFTTSSTYYTSDKNLKKNIQKISAPLERVMKLNPAYFQYDTVKGGQYGMNLPNGYNYGFIAQDLEQVFPELVINNTSAPILDSNGVLIKPQINFKSVNYNGMIGIVTGAVQELNAKQQAMQASLDKTGLSDAQVKTNVNTFNALSTVKTLSPVKYNFTNSNVPQLNFKSNTDYGFIAQQLETVYPELVDTIRIDATYDSLGMVVNPSKVLKTVNYKAMSALLVRSIQEQQLTIDSLRNVQSKQDSINQAVQQQLAALASQINSCCSNTSARNANSNINQLDVELSDKDAIVLNQNVPNPFAEQTTITYNVPISVEKAQLIFFNANGQVIQTVDIKTRGKGKVNVFAADLSSGLYHYTLVADGKVVDSKKMVRE